MWINTLIPIDLPKLLRTRKISSMISDILLESRSWLRQHSTTFSKNKSREMKLYTSEWDSAVYLGLTIVTWLIVLSYIVEYVTLPSNITIRGLKLTNQLTNQLNPNNQSSETIQIISVHSAVNTCNQSGRLNLLWETIKYVMMNFKNRSNLIGLNFLVLTKAMTSFQTSIHAT